MYCVERVWCALCVLCVLCVRCVCVCCVLCVAASGSCKCEIIVCIHADPAPFVNGGSLTATADSNRLSSTIALGNVASTN